jgi:signal transduction histidine kinase
MNILCEKTIHDAREVMSLRQVLLESFSQYLDHEDRIAYMINDAFCRAEELVEKSEDVAIKIVTDKTHLNSCDTIYITVQSLISKNWSSKFTAHLRKPINSVEIDDLSHNLNQPTKQELFDQLQKQNDSLGSALTSLKQAQADLVQSEKLASLSNLVAGIAHEINTPVGVSLTATTALLDETQQVVDLFSTGKFRRSDLERFFRVCEDSTQLLQNNLERAAKLVSSFKNIAIDQVNQERRSFNVGSYIDEALLTLSPILNKEQLSVEVICPDDLWIDSFPSAISQIVSNLISNSVMHAFTDIEFGDIKIEIFKEKNNVVFQYQDSGIGMSADTLDNLFDPFFTTSRNRGSSGLGMSVVHNLVTDVLKGNIHVSSKVNNGTAFTIEFPETKHAQG